MSGADAHPELRASGRFGGRTVELRYCVIHESTFKFLVLEGRKQEKLGARRQCAILRKKQLFLHCTSFSTRRSARF